MPRGHSLNILHVFRAPVGGLFRHVLDLARGQAERGHCVGLIADSSTGGERAETALRALAPQLTLGISRIPMSRHPGPQDLAALFAVNKRVRAVQADIVHGHGAKGGLYARLAYTSRRAVRAYTPHGGSLWFEPNTLTGIFYLTAEKMLMRRGNLYLFESTASRDTFLRKIGKPLGVARVVHNGVGTEEFESVAPEVDASDVIFLGELRALKGIDLLIEALAQLRANGRNVTATVVGDGPDHALLEGAARKLGGAVRFLPPMPARRAMALGRIMVVPSRNEGLPYVVLEAAAAGKPMIATRVGGIPEIFGPMADELVPAGNFVALGKAIVRALDNPVETSDLAGRLRERVRAEFSLEQMIAGVLDGYGAALAKST